MLITLFTRASLVLMVLVGKYVDAAVVRRVALVVVVVGVDVLAMLFNLKYTYCSTANCNFEICSSNLLQSPPILCKLKLKWSRGPGKAFDTEINLKSLNLNQLYDLI